LNLEDEEKEIVARAVVNTQNNREEVEVFFLSPTLSFSPWPFRIQFMLHFSVTKLYRQFTYVLALNGFYKGSSESTNVKIGK
jgi:hypothetical protein